MKQIRALVHRAGRRGAFLAFLALLDLAYGYSLFATAAPQRLYDLLLPWEAWGWIWCGTGVVCLARVFGRKDRVAFSVQAMLFFSWGMLSLDEWLAQGVERGWVSVVLWVAFALASGLVVGGWAEPPRGLPEIATPEKPDTGPQRAVRS